MKVSPTFVQNMGSSMDMDTTTAQTEMAGHLLPTAATLTIMDSNQPEPLMKIPISIRKNSL